MYFINDNVKVESQFDLLMADKGLAPAGRARLSQSIKAFVYCILG